MLVNLRWEPDVENYKLEAVNQIAFGGIPKNADIVKRKIDELRSDGIALGSLIGEVHEVKQIKLDMLESIVLAKIKRGENPLDVDYNIARTFIDNVEYLVVWA